MPQVFPRQMNVIAQVSIYGAVFMLAGAIAIGMFVVRSPYVTEAGVIREQPVPFSHKHHVGDVGIDCRYCHTSVETSAFAGIPSTEICMGCHSQLWKESEMLAPVRESYRTSTALHWTRVHNLPDFAYFNHSIHIHKGIGCTSCHGDVAEMPLMWREKTLMMEWCLECHRHPEQYVRPRSEVFSVNWNPPSNQQQLGEKLIGEYRIQKLTDCYTCHR